MLWRGLALVVAARAACNHTCVYGGGVKNWTCDGIGWMSCEDWEIAFHCDCAGCECAVSDNITAQQPPEAQEAQQQVSTELELREALGATTSDTTSLVSLGEREIAVATSAVEVPQGAAVRITDGKLRGVGRNRLLTINSETAVEIVRVDFEGGADVMGGCVFAYRSAWLLITDGTFRNCSAELSGGALQTYTATELTVRSVRFEDVFAGGSGAAIQAWRPALVDVADATFSRCHAVSTMEANRGCDGGGGAVQVVYAIGNIFVSRSSFVNCTSSEGWGGALMVHGYESNGVVEVSDSRFEGCQVFFGGGGALIVHQVASVTLRSVTFRRNFATSEGGCVAVSDAGALVIEDVDMRGCVSDLRGGGILAVMLSRFEVRRAHFADCIAGVSLEDDESPERVSGPSETNSGGGISLRGFGETNAVLEDVVFERCETRGDAGGGGVGGAMVARGARSFDSTRVSVSRAFAYYGGGLYFDEVPNASLVSTRIDSAAAFDGGALYATGSCNLVLSDLEVTNCTAENNGGAVATFGSRARFDNSMFVGNSAADDGGAMYLCDRSRVHVYRSDIADNVAGGNGGGIFMQGANSLLYLSSGMCAYTRVNLDWSESSDGLGDTWLVIGRQERDQDILQQNGGGNDPEKATEEEEEDDDQESRRLWPFDAHGLAMTDVRPWESRLVVSTFCLEPGRAYDVQAQDRDGVGWGTNGKVVVECAPSRENPTGEVEISNLERYVHGERVATLAVPEIDDASRKPVRFVRNVATSGGAIGLTSNRNDAVREPGGPELYATQVVFQDNFARVDGGGILQDQVTTAELVNVTATNNSVHQNGGGFLAAYELTWTTLNHTIADNNVARFGGFAYVYDARQVVVFKSFIAANRAQSGGGVHITGTLRQTAGIILQCTIVDNVAQYQGGAIQSNDGNVDLARSLFARNEAEYGGAIHQSSGGASGGYAFGYNLGDTDGDKEGEDDGEYDNRVVRVADERDACRSAHVVMDWRDTGCASVTEATTVATHTCQSHPQGCERYIDSAAADVCNGCACANFDAYSLSTSSRTADGEMVVTPFATGVPSADGVAVDSFCLEPGTYTLFATCRDQRYAGRFYVFVDGAIVVDGISWNTTTAAFPETFVVEPSPGAYRYTNFVDNHARSAGGVVFYEALDRGKVGVATHSGSSAGAYGDVEASYATILDVGNFPSHFMSGVVVSPSIVVSLCDAFDQVVATDSYSRVTVSTANDDVAITGATALCEAGLCQFHELVVLSHENVVNATFEFGVLPTSTSFITPTRSFALVGRYGTRENKSFLSPLIKMILVGFLGLNVMLAGLCAAFVHRYRRRFIMRMSQPLYLHLIILGSVSYSFSYLPYVAGLTDFSCNAMIWLYNLGFCLQMAAFFTRISTIERVIDSALVFEEPRLDLNHYARAFVFVLFVSSGILVAWLLVSPLHSKRSCFKRRKRSDYRRIEFCKASVRTCHSKHAIDFIGALATFHILCYFAGFHHCHLARNLPSIVCDARNVFNALCGQLQFLLVAIPLFYLIRDQVEPFSMLHALSLTLTNIFTLGLIFIPKMRLIHKYVDFDANSVLAYIQKSMPVSTQDDHVFKMLAVAASDEASSDGADTHCSLESPQGGDPASSIFHDFHHHGRRLGGALRFETSARDVNSSALFRKKQLQRYGSEPPAKSFSAGNYPLRDPSSSETEIEMKVFEDDDDDDDGLGYNC
ncbi:hypothetical protein CTAYLR_005825 [Chrysophaeum taylorii]|uniref:G-protein coupled receptors family 3 profile domain-containing protein n=1 Tax=Chrysophaeum taylorii TaxID=2483200 RepID=A0AAD7UR35_9STRA|nr:hypothetical protein CTAYLR_005825 [Chrysophaeum taylorii]